ncbi:MAG: hypothetical protein MJZ34_02620 [Paludibacteraceae bacterium]|nr:hypothetical protein [Paludibacteraceae bacterium]
MDTQILAKYYDNLQSLWKQEKAIHEAEVALWEEMAENGICCGNCTNYKFCQFSSGKLDGYPKCFVEKIET